MILFFFFQAEDGIRDLTVTGVQTCALPILPAASRIISRRLPTRAAQRNRGAKATHNHSESQRTSGPGHPRAALPSQQHTPPSLPRCQLRPQRRQLAPHRAVVDPVAYPYYHAAQDPLIGAEMGPDLLADGLRQPLDDRLLEPRVRLLEEGHARVHPVELDVHQCVILLGDLAQEPLPAAPHHRLEKAHELRRRHLLQRALEQRRLHRLGDARRLERHRDALVRLHRPRHRLHELPVALDRSHAVRVGRQEQRLGVIARDGGALHRARSRFSRYSVTRRRLAWESRFASISLDAAAIERSTASRRSSRMAFSFSPSMSLRARSNSCSYCSRACASSAARSFSATVRACAISSCASARAAATRRLCSSSRRAASARARSASSSCCWMRRSRSSTALRRAGHPSFHSSASRIPKTTRVQKISPVLMENGVNSSPCRSEEHTSELQSQSNLVCRLLLEKKTIVPPEISHGRGLATCSHYS